MRAKFSGRVAGIFVATDPSTFVTVQVSRVDVSMQGFREDILHYGETTKSDSRLTFLYPKGTKIRNLRPVSLVSKDELDQIAIAMDIPEVRPEWVGANLAIEGIRNLTTLPIGLRLHFHRPGKEGKNGQILEDDTILMVSGENLPCPGPGEIIARKSGHPEAAAKFVKAALHLRGITAWVERPGYILHSDTMELVISPSLKFALEGREFFTQ